LSLSIPEAVGIRNGIGVYTAAMKRALFSLAWIVAAALSPAVQAAGHAALIEIEGAIGPASSGYFQKAHGQAVAGGASLIVLRLDTPGGLDTAMRDIVKTLLASPLLFSFLVGLVCPLPASAGTYILYACHIAAMAPATNLGAATPVPIGGSWPMGKDKPANEGGEAEAEPEKTGQQSPGRASEPLDAMGRKAVNDAVAYLRSIAETRGRNAEWAEHAVRGGESLSAEKALELKVIDLIAADVPALLAAVDGRSVALQAGAVTLKTAGISVEKIEPDWRMLLLGVITNPTLAYILMLIGIYGLLLEGYHPGAILPGVTGAICLLLALYAFQVLPVNYVGLGLILLGIALMVGEALAPSFGILGFGGIIAFVLGSILLMDMDVPGYGVNVGLIAGIATVASALMGLTLYLLWRARHSPTVTGDSILLGHTVEFIEPAGTAGEGWALVRGERWRVRSSRPLAAGERARVVRVEGLLLYVEPEN
jgi:membrane-bound serine protease (ClpP class)